MKKTYIAPAARLILLGSENLIAQSIIDKKNENPLDGNDGSGSGGEDNSQWSNHRQSIWGNQDW